MNTHGPLRIEPFVEPSFQENGYLLWVDGIADAWAVDPGLPPTPQRMTDAIRRRELALRAIVITHGHADHIAGIPALRERFLDARLIAPEGDRHMLTDAAANLSAPMGFPIVASEPDDVIRPGDTLALGELTWHVLDVSGHSPGGVALHCPVAGVVLTGDALFAGSIGRTDFPGSSGRRLLDNIRQNLLTLPDDTVVYSGHGPATTIGQERLTNPFLDGAWLE